MKSKTRYKNVCKSKSQETEYVKDTREDIMISQTIIYNMNIGIYPYSDLQK